MQNEVTGGSHIACLFHGLGTAKHLLDFGPVGIVKNNDISVTSCNFHDFI